MQKTMIIMYNNLWKRILFSSLSIYFFPHFFPSPNPNFGASWEKMGIFSILKIESLFPSLSLYFFPIPKSKFRCVLGKNGVGPPPDFIKFAWRSGNFMHKMRKVIVKYTGWLDVDGRDSCWESDRAIARSSSSFSFSSSSFSFFFLSSSSFI